MSHKQTTQALKRLFGKHRIVFWYDTKQELRHEYDALDLPGVEKIELANNQYGIKYRLLREEPKQKFLLYYKGPQPSDLDNWLLDVQLAQGKFSADQVSLWVTELGLRQEYFPLVQEHAEFFKAASRRGGLKNRLSKDDSHNGIRTKMLAVCINSDTEARLESILENLLSDLANDREEKINLIQRCGLDTFLWQRMEIHFGYSSETPGIRDFVFTLFKACYAISLEEEASLSQDALVFLKRWKDSRRHHEAFERLSEQYAKDPALERDLQDRDLRALIDMDYFKLIDQKILSDLVRQVVERTIAAGECAKIIWNRRTTYWFTRYSQISHAYEAINFGSQFIAELDKVDLRMQSLADGIQKYQNTWYLLDQYYRKFIYHVRASKQSTLLQALIEQVENLYSNNYLLTLNDNWQIIIDEIKTWDASPFIRQDEFFNHWINEYIRNKNKVVVIISDALRFEIAQELITYIEKEEGYTAEIQPMLSMLPSYTQLGMAALLPHNEITIGEDGNVQIDGQSTTGLDNRSKLLAQTVEEGAIAIRAADLHSMNRDQYREATKGYQVIYVYHNQIDSVGDDKTSEGRVFDAVESTFPEIVDLLKKLSDSYFINILVTSDHGFIYQNQKIDESEFAGIDLIGEEIYKRTRRFVVGKRIKPNPSAKQFHPADLGLTGEYEVFIPKSINRLRLKGAGSRYVHGGASLQEVVLPVIKVNKKRTKDVSHVEVDIISSASTIITSGQLSVAFYQTEPASAKIQARKLRAGIYSQDGNLISNPEELNFDFTSENPREREVKVRFVLSRKADDVNNQTVYLRLEEQVPGTSHYPEYKSFPYQLRRSFTSDFDL